MGRRANEAWTAFRVLDLENIGDSARPTCSHGWTGNEPEGARMLDQGYRLSPYAGDGGRASGKETMARPRYQDGSLSVRGRKKVWIARWREDVIREDGTMARTHRRVVLGAVNELSRREAMAILQARVSEVNQGRRRAIPTMTLAKFASEHWQAGVLLALKPSSARYYQY